MLPVGFTRPWFYPYLNWKSFKVRICSDNFEFKKTADRTIVMVFLYSRLADIFEKHLSVVRRAGVTPYIVFDGLPLPAKASKVKDR